ncbi:aryl-alcohol dehydrogenase-like predicted oxidoreductase [Aerococcus sp. 150760007-1]|uniref:Aldo/keto reductase n=1 Tax=Aerococcus urinaeequi TaxID=51665 RepID=A0ABR5ZZ33_9LACT|nr:MULTISPECIES: hypothetical protein [Lactobacillales]KAF3301019.1 hypothetical protein FPV22_05790 [Carnobacterium sp. PL26RED25]KAF3305417.1 hypothetical protein FPV24_05865 [Carnobacterium sp. PL24RED07]MBA5747004.1 hypothetical protein [Aerococcus urinaeequi]MBA5829788.1 hypothetical protein [Aerococcus urinaeequi]MBA5860738.1 hypothetical protein [Aerococcus urinaeequi]
MKTRHLGDSEVVVTEIGFGAMDMSLGYGVRPNRQDMIQALGNVYGMGNHYTPEMQARVDL